MTISITSSRDDRDDARGRLDDSHGYASPASPGGMMILVTTHPQR